MEKLKTFIRESGGTQSKLARQARISDAHLSEFLSGKKPISVDVAVRLSEATGGKVTVADLLPHLARVFLKAAS